MPKITCNYCGAPISSSLGICSYCNGSPNIISLRRTRVITSLIKHKLKRLKKDLIELKKEEKRKELLYETRSKVNILINKSKLKINQTGIKLKREYERFEPIAIEKLRLKELETEIKSLNNKIKEELKKERTKRILYRYIPIGITSLGALYSIKFLIDNTIEYSNYISLRNSGFDNYENKNFKAAINDLNKAAKINSQDKRLFIIRGLSKNKLGNSKGTIMDLNKAIYLAEDSPEIHFSLANAKIQSGLYNQAIYDIDIGIKHKKADDKFLVGAYLLRGEANSLLGNHISSLSDYKNSISIKPTARGHSLSCYAFQNLNEYQKAIDECRKSISIEDSDPLAYVNLGINQSKLGDITGSCSNINKAISLGYRKGDTKWIQSYKEGCKNQEIKIKKESELNKDRKNKSTSSEEANYYIKRLELISDSKGNCKNTIQLSKMLIPLHGNSISYYYRAQGNGLCGNYEDAISDYSKAIELEDLSSRMTADVYNNRGLNKDKIEDFKGAISDYTQAIRISNKQIYYKNRASSNVQVGSYKDAIKDYSKVIQMGDKNFGLRKRGEVKMLLGSHVSAINDFSSALKLNYDDYESYLKRAFSKYELKDYSSSCKDLKIYARNQTYGKMNRSHFAMLKKVKHKSQSAYNIYKKYCD